MKFLELLKANEQPLPIYLILDDPIAKTLLSAWTLYAPQYIDRELPENGTIQEARKLVWDGVVVDYARLSELANMPMLSTMSQFNRLRDAGLVYPDGSIHATVYSILRAEINRYIREIVPPQRPASIVRP